MNLFRRPAAGEPVPPLRVFRVGLTNHRTIPLILQLEPWAYDYTAAPGQRLELVVRSALPDLWFDLSHNDNGTVEVAIEGEGVTLDVAYEVLLDGIPIQIGHNRQLWA